MLIGIAIYIGLLVPFLWGKKRQFASRRRDVWKDHRLILTGLFFVVTWLALPIGLIFDWIKDWFEKKFGEPGKQNFIDVWHFLFLVGSFAILYFKPTPLLLVIPVLKLMDVFQTLLGFMINGRPPPRSPRPIVHLLFIHYPQVVVTFAGIFVMLSARCGDGLFVGKHMCGQLRPSDALYFSLVSAFTVGFGDITPNLPSQTLSLALLRRYCIPPSFYVMLEIGAILVLTPLFVPFFTSGMSASGTKQETGPAGNGGPTHC